LRWLRRHDQSEARTEALDDVVRSLRAGASLLQALDDTAARSPVLARVMQSVRRGSSLPATLEQWARDTTDADEHSVASALLLAVDAGGPPARALEAAGSSVRDRRAARHEARAHAATARASAGVMVLLPPAFLALSTPLDGGLGALLATPRGAVCLVLGLVLDIAGALWMARLVRNAV